MREIDKDRKRGNGKLHLFLGYNIIKVIKEGRKDLNTLFRSSSMSLDLCCNSFPLKPIAGTMRLPWGPQS